MRKVDSRYGIIADLRFGNCLDLMSKLPNNSVDLIATDPAYESMLRWQGIGSTARMGMGRKGSGSDDIGNKFFPIISNEDLPDFIQECHRVLRPERHCYIMCDFETLKLLHYFAITEGVFAPVGYGGLFESCKPLIWNKVSPGMGYTYRCQYEFIFMLWKGKKRRLNDLGISDVLTYKKPGGKDKIFPTQKPVELFETLIKQSTKEGELVLDPFLGSGTTGVACVRTGRNFIGMEVDKRAFDLAENRINAEMEEHLG